jgi:hypothetical protein
MDHARRQALRSAYAYGTSTSWLSSWLVTAQMRATAPTGCGSEKQASNGHHRCMSSQLSNKKCYISNLMCKASTWIGGSWSNGKEGSSTALIR